MQITLVLSIMIIFCKVFLLDIDTNTCKLLFVLNIKELTKCSNTL